MGCCFSSCLPESDMATELEAELDDNSMDNALLPGGGKSSFGTALLSSGEVVCKQVIGNGSSGVVYKGSYRGSVVAVKKVTLAIIPEKVSARESVCSSLEQEANRMGSLRHPNIVLFMGACLQENLFCIVSEYCTRGSLYDVLHPRRKCSPKSGSMLDRASSSESNASDGFPPALHLSLRLRLALGAIRGLLYLHSADPPLVHGRLKSTNILVDDSWNAKLADFGTRRVAEAVISAKGPGRRSDLHADTEIDTEESDAQLLRWTAPELLHLGPGGLQSKPGQTEGYPQAVDIYSFGIVLWELTTGRVPFAEVKSNQEIMDIVLSGERPEIPVGVCSEKWETLIKRCWSQEPSKRPNAGEIVTILEEVSKSACAETSNRETVSGSCRTVPSFARYGVDSFTQNSERKKTPAGVVQQKSVDVNNVVQVKSN